MSGEVLTRPRRAIGDLALVVLLAGGIGLGCLAVAGRGAEPLAARGAAVVAGTAPPRAAIGLDEVDRVLMDGPADVRLQGRDRSGRQKVTQYQSLGLLEGHAAQLARTRLDHSLQRSVRKAYAFWQQIGDRNPSLEEMAKGAELALRVESDALLLERFDAGRYYTMRPGQDIVRSSDDVVYTAIHGIGFVAKRPVVIVFPISISGSPRYVAAHEYRDQMRRMSLGAFVNRFNGAPEPQRRERARLAFATRERLRDAEYVVSLPPSELAAVQQHLLPDGVVYDEATALLSLMKGL